MVKNKLLKGPFLPFIFLSFFYFLWSANLVRVTLQAVDYDPQNDRGLFQSESAFQYRYARMVALGKPIPDFDLAAQWPEGLMTRQVIHTLMDQVAGGIYRTFIPPTIPFHLYMLYFVAHFSALTIFPLFFLIWKLSQKPWLAFLSSTAYAMTYATYGRSLGGYLHENFALPFLFLFLCCFYLSLHPPSLAQNHGLIRRGVLLTLAGASLLVALASWHLSHFFFTAFAVSLLLSTLWHWKKIKDFEGAESLLTSFFALLPFMILAGLILPTLRYQGFLLSPAMIFCFGLLGAWWACKVKGSARFILVGLILVGAGAALFFSSRHWGQYSHVYDLLFYKLRFLGQKPADPSRLSYDARVFWTAGFDTPTFKDLVMHYNLLLPLGLGGLVLYLSRSWRKKEGPHILGLALLTLIFLALSFLLLRMGVFLSFLLALFVPYWWGEPNRTSASSDGQKRNRTLKWIGGLSLVSLLAFQLFFALAFKFDKPIRQENLLLQWIIRHTGPQEAFLTPFELGPTILTYTGRPVVLHSMFEEKEIREKNQKFLEALYGSEEDFYHYCRQVGARYFLYQCFLLLDTSPDSNRYVAAKMKLVPEAAAFRLHFQEKKLKYFQLVFQEGPFRLYQVKDSVETKKQEVLSLYGPFFNPALFGLTPEASEIDRAQIQRGMEKIELFQEQIKLVGDFMRNKTYNKALICLSLAENMDPVSPVPPYMRARLYLQQNQRDLAQKELEKALEKNPHYIYAQDLLHNLISMKRGS